jgi:hypothetical protein
MVALIAILPDEEDRRGALIMTSRFGPIMATQFFRMRSLAPTPDIRCTGGCADWRNCAV